MLRFDPGLLHDLRRHGEEAYPAEACGVLLGAGPDGERRVTGVARCANTAAAPARRWAIDERELLRLAKAARAAGQEIVGFYHSHPDAPARPSPSDLAEAWWTGCTWVITAVAAGQAGETSAWRLQGREAERSFVPERMAAEAR